LTDTRYTLREAAAEIGSSASWIRARIRAGQIAKPQQVQGPHGKEYRLSAGEVEALRNLYPAKSRRSADTRIARYMEHEAEQQDRLQRALLAIAAAEARGQAERERAERAEAALAAEQERARMEQKRIEALKSLTVFDYLRGKHKTL